MNAGLRREIIILNAAIEKQNDHENKIKVKRENEFLPRKRNREEMHFSSNIKEFGMCIPTIYYI